MNTNLLNTNIELLKAYGYDSDIINDEEFGIEKTKDNMLTYQYPLSNGKKIYIHSKYNVNREIDNCFKNIDFNKDALYIVYGLGMGYHIEELKKQISSKSIVFIIEKDYDIISTFMKNRVFENIAGENIFCLFGNEDDILTKINNLIFNFSVMPLVVNLCNVIIPSYNYIYGKWIADFNERLIDVIKHTYFILGNDMQDTIDGIENNFKNIKELIKSPSIELVKDKYKEKPVIIVSAGPSLNNNIHLLKEVKGKALIFAADAVLTILRNNDIVPDAVFSIERMIGTYEMFYKDKVINEKIVFVGPPVVRKEMLECLKGNKKLLCLKKGENINEWINNKILGENRLFQMGTSCSHIAFAFAKHIGANPIVFIGQDLAYTKDGVTHSEGVETKGKVEIDKEKEKVLYVKGINGDILPTSGAYKNFLTWFEMQIASDSSREYIDATEGGAYIKGTKVTTLNEVIARHCKNEIKPLYSLIPKENFLDERFEKAITELEELNNKFDKIRVEAERHILRIDKLQKKVTKDEKNLSQNDLIKIYNVLNKVTKTENFILEDGIVRTYFQAVVMTALAQVKMLKNDINTKTSKKNVIIQKKMVASIILGCFAVQNSLLKLINDMKNDEEYKFQ